MFCRHIGLLFGKRLDKILLGHRWRKYSDLPTTRYRIRCSFFFPLWRADSKISGFAAEFARYVWTDWKPHLERKSCGFKNIQISVDGNSLIIVRLTKLCACNFAKHYLFLFLECLTDRSLITETIDAVILDYELKISIALYLRRAQPESTITRYSSPLNFFRFLLV